MGDAAPDLRVEDLARAADVSVDTIRFYQKRRLLDGELDAADVPLAAAVAAAATSPDDDAAELLTLDDVAARAGVPRPILEAVVRAGVLVPRATDGAEAFTTADVELVGAGLRLLEAGFPLADLL